MHTSFIFLRATLIVVLALSCFSPLRAQEPDAKTPTLAADVAPAVAAAAATAPTPEQRIEKIEKELLLEASKSGHNAWMLTSSALVLFMTAPGLAMFYSGLVRKKNVLGVMMQCIFLMGLMTVIWGTYGYSLSFGGDPTDPVATGYSPYFGNGQYLFMKDVERTWSEKEHKVITPYEGLIPRMTHMLFQGMFFIITPALICGAFAERMKFSTMVVFCILWGTFIYCPLCHWVWDGGILSFTRARPLPEGGYALRVGFMGGALDFAGGTVVHISSGASALLCALVMGKRLGYGNEQMPPHNLTYTTLGAAMLWVGWFGFNAGSQLGSDGLTSSAFMTTHFSAAAGTLSWAAMEWIFRGKPSVLGACSGAVAGLVCITPAAGFVGAMPAFLMGALAGMLCFWSCTKLKSMFKYDDSLDAFGVHGVGGTFGAILTGVFATKAAADDAVFGGESLGLVDGVWGLFFGQIFATAFTWVFALVGTFILLKILDATMGLRVSRDAELQGLDLSEHGEEGYIFH